MPPIRRLFWGGNRCGAAGDSGVLLRFSQNAANCGHGLLARGVGEK